MRKTTANLCLRVSLNSFLSALFALTLSLPASGYAQSVEVKDVSASEESTTTIEIRKGKKAEERLRAEAIWKVVEGKVDLEGESAPLRREARALWRQACEEWKQEFRADNQSNQIISLNCGRARCAGQAGFQTCTSIGKYRVKTRMDQ